VLGKHLKPPTVTLCLAGTLVGIAYIALALSGKAPGLDSCITETKDKITTSSGLGFTIRETNCSAFAKDSSVSILINDEDEEDLIFKYDPSWNNRRPTISISDRHEIKISVNEVSSIIYQQDKWKTMPIKYDIGHIVFPTDAPGPGK
jgi:hypothetical protein